MRVVALLRCWLEGNQLARSTGLHVFSLLFSPHAVYVLLLLAGLSRGAREPGLEPGSAILVIEEASKEEANQETDHHKDNNYRPWNIAHNRFP
jgi:hypothetical protein